MSGTWVDITSGGGGGGSPAGSNGDIQINSSGAFGALHVGTGIASDGTSLNVDCTTTACQGSANNFSANGNTYAGRTDIFCSNNATTGTTVNLLAKFDASGNCILAATTDTVGIIGIVASGAGTTGTARVARQGTIQCTTDNTVTAGDYAIIGTTTAGACKDGGASRPPGGNEIIGVFGTSGLAGTLESVTLLLDSNPAVASGGTVPFAWGIPNNTLAAAASGYEQLGTSGGGSGTAWIRAVLAPVNTTLTTLALFTSNTQPADGSFICTMQTGTGTGSGTDTTLSVTVPAGGLGGLRTATSSVAIPAGSWGALHCVNNSPTATSTTLLQWAVQ